MADFHKGDIGSRILLHITEDGSDYDVSDQTTMQVKIQSRESGTTKTFSASYATSPHGNGTGTDGKIEYVTVATGDLDQVGVYDTQAYLVLPNVFTGHTQLATFTVDDTL